MKAFHKTILLFALLTLFTTSIKSQVLSENFNTGLPAGWTQFPVNTWSLASETSTPSNSYIAAGNDPMAYSVTTLFTPTLDLSAVINLTITFKAAIVKNNFVSPDIYLSYDAGNGPQSVASWGTGYSTTTYTINDSFDPSFPPTNIIWESCVHKITVINSPAVKFRFSAEFPNYGYVLFDDIVIAGKKRVTTGVNETLEDISFRLFPNPAHNKKVTLEGEAIKEVMVSDNIGRSFPVQHHQLNANAIEIELNNFPNGVYYINATTETNTVISKKIILE